MILKKTLSLIVTLCMAVSIFVLPAVPVNAAVEYTEPAAAADYGLADSVQEGVILHAWNWSFNNIKAQMKTIAESGYTAIQTSPIQIAKENTKNVSVGNWWVFYQPAGFTIDNTGGSALGNKADFKAMCDEAHKYGIRIIVDVVANHLGNRTDWTNLCDRAYQYEPEIANNWLFHNEGNQHDGNAYNVVKGQIGMPDLRTEDSRVQNRVISFLKECIDNGADGFRWDAAKHIETPDDGANGSQFWPNVLNAAKSYYASKGTYDELYNYGEILNTPGSGRSYGSYTKYMSITDNTTGNNIRSAVAGGNASGAATPHYNTGQSASKIVLWAESHDTYSNESRESTGVSDANINKAWAMVGSRNGATALYYARSRGYRGGMLGNIESTQWKSKEVTAVNQFHNYFSGESEYLASSGSIAYNERGTSGVVLVNVSGNSASVNVKANKMKDGTYTDQISGNTFTVSGGQIKGQIGSTGIAVVYNAVTEPKNTVSPEDGKFTFRTDTLKVSLGLSNATSGTYQIDNGAVQTYRGDTTVTIGKNVPVNTEITLKVTATDGAATTEETYTFFKKDPNAVTRVYFDNSQEGWSQVYCYIYKNTGSSGGDDIGGGDSGGNTGGGFSNTIKFTDSLGWGNVNAYFFNESGTCGAEWPGSNMTWFESNFEGKGNYQIDIPSGATSVVFNNGSAQTVDLSLGAEGYWLDGSQTDGKYNANAWDAAAMGGDSGGNTGGGGFSGTIKFTDSLGWGNVNAYFFNESGTCGAEWPGSNMTWFESNFEGKGNYQIDIPSGATSVVFNNGSAQTVDLSLGAEGYWLDGTQTDGKYNANAWDAAAMAIHTMSTTARVLSSSVAVPENAPWPGELMTKENDNLYSYEVPEEFEDNCCVLFTAGMDGPQIPGQEEPGMQLSGTSMIYQDGKWAEYIGSDPIRPTAPTDPDDEDDPTTPTVPTVPEGEKYMLGDSNGDLKISLDDVLYMQMYLSNKVQFTPLQVLSADVNRSGEVNLADILIVQQYFSRITINDEIGKIF